MAQGRSIMLAKMMGKMGAGWMVLSCLCFALMGVFVKLGANYYNFIELVFWRGLFGVFMMGGIAVVKGQTFKTPLVKQHIARSIAGVVSLLAYFYAMTNLPLATAVTLNYTSPIFVVLLSFFFLKVHISKVTALGILIGFCGVLLLLQPNFRDDAWVAVVIGLISGLISGIAYIQIQQLTRLNEPEWRVVFYFSVVMCLFPSMILTVTQSWQPLYWVSSIYLIGMGFFAAVAQFLMTKAYSVSNIFVVTATSYITIIFSTILGAWFLGESLHWVEFVAMIVIIASGLITKLGNILPVLIKRRFV